MFLWFKALHLIAMVCWFAGLFYLPRLFVYHAMSEDQVSHERFIIMERKLYRGIMTPSAILTLLFGLGMLHTVGFQAYAHQGWLHVKLTLVLLLLGYHHGCGRYVKKFKAGQNTRSHVYYRWFNEVPVIFLISIILLATLKPF